MNYEAGSLYDEESYRSAMSKSEFDRYDQMLRDEWAAKVYFANKAMASAAHCRQKIQQAAAEGLGGMYKTMQMHPVMAAWLNQNYPGWQECESFAKDLMRYHPEIKVDGPKSANKTGWTPAVEKSAAPVKRLVLTDRRGNAA